MGYCDVVITNDTGLMHIATAMHRKIVAIFGSTVREFGFFPYDPSAVVIERQGLACRPCSHIGRSECPEKHFRCMMEIGDEEVYARFERTSDPHEIMWHPFGALGTSSIEILMNNC